MTNNIAYDDLMTLIPLDGFAGKLYRSVMPYGIHDTGGIVMAGYKEVGIQAVVLLASDEECYRRAKRSLRDLYAKEKMQVLYLPTPDFGVPDLGATAGVVGEALTLLRSGRTVAVQCSAGWGRTGLFLACLGGAALAKNSRNAISWVRSYLPGAVETGAQEEFVGKLLEKGGK